LHASMLAYGGKKADGNNRKNNKVHAPIWHLAKIYYDFPLYRSPQNFLHSVSQSLPVLMLTAFFGPASAGFYVLCTRVVGMPSQLVAKAVGDVFYPRISEAAHNRENLGGLILKATAALAGLAIFPFGILAIFGPLLFAFVFGKEWSVAGQYAQWLALYMFLNFVNKACVVAIPVLALQGFLLSYEMTAIAVRVIGLTLGFYVYHSALIAIALFSIAGFIMYIFLIWYVLAKSRTGKKR
jgi:O-antigen/teichoic acid export membrane protein